MLWIPKLFGKKIVVTIHGLDWQRSKWGGFATKYIKFGEKMAVKYADEIIVLSENVKNYFKENYNRETHFIPNGVNKPTKKAPNIIKEKYELDKDSYILFLARIVPEKGLDYLIDSYTQINTDKKLVIAGGASHTGEYYQAITQKCKNNKNIIMTGFVQGDELAELYSNCFLYVLPSDVEGMPISLLEAMSYGRNCLVSDIEENTQVTEKFAVTFKKSNIEDLKQKLEECLQGKNRYSEEEISEFILGKYNWDEVVEETEKLYRKARKIEIVQGLKIDEEIEKTGVIVYEK
jgi:glycosyltransferase involved in cell wall biosynthesis